MKKLHPLEEIAVNFTEEELFSVIDTLKLHLEHDQDLIPIFKKLNTKLNERRWKYGKSKRN